MTQPSLPKKNIECDICGKKGKYDKEIHHYIGGCIGYAHPECAKIGDNYLELYRKHRKFWKRMDKIAFTPSFREAFGEQERKETARAIFEDFNLFEKKLNQKVADFQIPLRRNQRDILYEFVEKELKELKKKYGVD